MDATIATNYQHALELLGQAIVDRSVANRQVLEARVEAVRAEQRVEKTAEQLFGVEARLKMHEARIAELLKERDEAQAREQRARARRRK